MENLRTTNTMSEAMAGTIESVAASEDVDGFDLQWIAVFLSKAADYDQWITMMRFGIHSLLKRPEVLFALIAQGVTNYDANLRDALGDLGLAFILKEEGSDVAQNGD